MNQYYQLYLEKCVVPEELAARVNSGDVCASPPALGEPRAIVQAIARRARNGELEHVQHHITFPQYPSPYYEEELNGRYNGVLWFTGSVARPAVQAGRADIMPGYFNEFPSLWRSGLNPNVFCAAVSPMDEHGYFSLGPACGEGMAQLERANLVLLEVNRNIPRVLGEGLIHITQVDGLCENDEPPLSLPESGEPDRNSQLIGSYIAEEIEDGSTLQLGWGAVPDVVGAALREKHDLGLHTELFTSSMMDLIECGAVTNRRKAIDRNKSIATFALGTQRMYHFLDDNPGVELRGVDYVNNPDVIAKNDRMISINACVEVDFFGQVVAETIGGKWYSGTGGQVDFVRGARMSRGGKSFIATHSTAKGGTVSRIVSRLTIGSVVTTSKNEVDYIVTEYGIACLRGKTVSQRTKALIAVAHPDFRDQLRFEAKNMGLLI